MCELFYKFNITVFLLQIATMAISSCFMKIVTYLFLKVTLQLPICTHKKTDNIDLNWKDLLVLSLSMGILDIKQIIKHLRKTMLPLNNSIVSIVIRRTECLLFTL